MATTPVVALYVEPQDRSTFLVSAMGSATTSVDLVAYILTDDDIEDALVAAHTRGLTVRVLLDGNQAANNTARNFLTSRGVQVRNGPQVFQNYHQKTVLVDSNRAFIMTLNPSYSAFNFNREYAAEITATAEVADVKRFVDADWASDPNPPVTSNLVVSPNNARSRLADLIRRAQTDILVCVETFSDEALRQLLKQRLDAGVTVRVIMAHPSDVDQNAQDGQTLLNRGIPVRFLASPVMHAKTMLVDGRYGYVGSVNFTRTSMDQNREMGVMMEDAAAVGRLSAQAEADWLTATPP